MSIKWNELPQALAAIVLCRTIHAEFPTLKVVHAELPTQAEQTMIVHAEPPTGAGSHYAEPPTSLAVIHAETPTQSYSKSYTSLPIRSRGGNFSPTDGQGGKTQHQKSYCTDRPVDALIHGAHSAFKRRKRSWGIRPRQGTSHLALPPKR